MAIEIDEISERLGEIGGTLRAIQRQIDSMLVEQVRVQEGQRKIESGQLEIAIGASKRDDKTLLVERQITEISASLTKELTSLRQELQELKEMRWKASGFFLGASMLAGGTGGFAFSKVLEWMSIHLK
jgi:hypothetical protein